MVRIIIAVLLLFHLTGCSTKNLPVHNTANQAAQAKAQMDLLDGVWVGQRGIPYGIEDLRFVVKAGKASLQVIAGSVRGTVELSPDGVDQKGILFTFPPKKSQRVSTRQRIRPSLTTGLVRVSLKRKKVFLEFPTSQGKLVHGALLSRSRVPSKTRELVYGNAEGIQYLDWQMRENRGGSGTQSGQAKTRLAQTFKTLKRKGGWHCLTQNKVVASMNKAAKLISNERWVRLKRLYLIYAPDGNERLMYSVLNPGTLALQGQTNDYPVFVSTGPTTMIFTLHQDDPTHSVSLNSVPIHVFIFGNSFGDYGSGCDLDRIPSF